MGAHFKEKTFLRRSVVFACKLSLNDVQLKALSVFERRISLFGVVFEKTMKNCEITSKLRGFFDKITLF